MKDSGLGRLRKLIVERYDQLKAQVAHRLGGSGDMAGDALHEDDRIELLPPLSVDPKVARQRRAEHQRTERRTVEHGIGDQHEAKAVLFRGDLGFGIDGQECRIDKFHFLIWGVGQNS